MRNYNYKRLSKKLLINLKELILEEIKASKSLEYITSIIKRINKELIKLLKEIKSFISIKNKFINILLTKLKL